MCTIDTNLNRGLTWTSVQAIQVCIAWGTITWTSKQIGIRKGRPPTKVAPSQTRIN